MNKEQLKKLMAENESLCISIGTEIHIAIGESSVADLQALAQKQLMKGQVVTWQDRSRQWTDHKEVIDTSKEGSEMFTWDASGERIKMEKWLVTEKGGEQTREFLKHVWRKF